MKTLLISAALLGQLLTGYALADQASDELLAQCKQAGEQAGADNVEAFIASCLDEKLQYDTSEE